MAYCERQGLLHWQEGYRLTGLQTIKGKKYYFNSKGVLIKNKTSYKIKGKEYEINSEGVAIQVSALKAECLRKAKKFIEKHTTANMSNAQKFRTCFNYLMAIQTLSLGFILLMLNLRLSSGLTSLRFICLTIIFQEAVTELQVQWQHVPRFWAMNHT